MGRNDMAGFEEDTLLASISKEIAIDKGETEEKNEEVSTDEGTEEGDEDNGETSVDTDEEVGRDDEPEVVQAKPSRANDTIRALKEERKADRLEKEKLIAERATYAAQLENIRQQQQQQQSNADRRAEEDRLALLDPQERAIYQANEKANSLEHRLNLMQMQMQDNTDKAIFHAKSAHDETYAKYADQVEEMYQEGLKRGVTAPREELHSLILGRALKKDMAAKLSQKKATAGKRIDTVTSKPASARGDVAGSRQGKSEEDRLRGVLI
jgi:hypothetical protein